MINTAIKVLYAVFIGVLLALAITQFTCNTPQKYSKDIKQGTPDTVIVKVPYQVQDTFDKTTKGAVSATQIQYRRERGDTVALISVFSVSPAAIDSLIDSITVLYQIPISKTIITRVDTVTLLTTIKENAPWYNTFWTGALLTAAVAITTLLLVK